MRIILGILLFSSTLWGQIEFSSGMGINLTHQSSIQDYINTFYASPDNMLNSFNTSVEFFIETDIPISEKIDIGIDYNLSLFSYSVNKIGFANFNSEYYLHRPSVLAYYVFKGKGYKIKFGGGIGLRIAKLRETIFAAKNFSAKGIGLLFRAKGLTSLGGNLFAVIEGDIKFDFPGDLVHSNGNPLVDLISNEKINLNSIAFGLKLGVAYSL